MNEFTIYVKNKPGALAMVCDILYKNGVNIESLATEGTREDGTIKMITNDVNTTRRALDDEKMQYTVEEILVAKVLNRPGELSKLTRKIAEANISIISIYLLGEGKFALRVDNAEKAKEVLKDKIL
ncbi:MAG TPA: ACT domain-containing protein [archaeon]|nr:ACT domain-containing protein [archaeon]